MSEHKEKDSNNKAKRGVSRRAQLRQQQKTIELLNLKLESYLNAISIHYNQARESEKRFREALKLTPSEKSQLAHQEIQERLKLNEKICEMGACIHEEHQYRREE